jgi:hypothetical protein
MTILEMPQGKPLTPEQVALAERSEVHHPVMIGDVMAGIKRFNYTVGLVYGVTEDLLYERRFCFENHVDALMSLALWTAHPNCEHASGPWIKCKGVFRNATQVWSMDQGPERTLTFMADYYGDNGAGDPLKVKRFTEAMGAFDAERGYPLIAGEGVQKSAAVTGYKNVISKLDTMRQWQ